MFFISKIFQFFLTPSNIALLASGIGVALINTRYWKWGGRLAVGGVALLLLFGFGPLGDWLTVPLETRFSAPEKIAAPEGIIVLGGSVDEALSEEVGHVVVNDAGERLIEPLALARRFPKARIVFTGGSGRLTQGSKATEAGAVRRLWRHIGFDQGNVTYEDRSRTTYENAVDTRELVKPKAGERWLLVTSALHMPRAMGVFRAAGFNVVPWPVDFRTDGKMWRLSFPPGAPHGFELVDAAAHEWLGLLAYRLTGKSDALFPAP